MVNEKEVYKLADEVFGDGLFLMIHCPLCEWSSSFKIPSTDINRESLAGRPTLTWFERKQILTLRKQKKTYREISQITGFSLPTLEKYILKKKVLMDAKKELHKALLRHLQTHNNGTE